MKKLFTALLLSALGAGPLHAAVDFRPTYKSTVGSHKYRGSYLSLNVGIPIPESEENQRSLCIIPVFSSYKSEFSSGTIKNLSLRAEYSYKSFIFGAMGGRTPEHDGYKNRSFGSDVRYRFRLQGEEGGNPWRLKWIDVGGSLNVITHTDKFLAVSSTTVTVGKGRGRQQQEVLQERSDAIDIRQRDMSASAGFAVLKSYFSAETTVSSYNQDLQAISARAAEQEFLSGVDSVVQGFPHRSANVRLETFIIPNISPVISFTRTTFELDAPSARILGVGTYVDVGPVSLEGGIEFIRYENDLEPKQNTVSVGMEFQF
jgi:hypothetical protein